MTKKEEQALKRQEKLRLEFLRLEGMLESIGLPADRVCTYCWTGKE